MIPLVLLLLAAETPALDAIFRAVRQDGPVNLSGNGSSNLNAVVGRPRTERRRFNTV